MRETHCKPLAAWHGRGTAWARHAMCELAFRVAENFLYSFRVSNAYIYSVDRTDTRTAELISLRFYYANAATATKWDSHDAAPMTPTVVVFFSCNYMAASELCNAEKSRSVIRSIYQPT